MDPQESREIVRVAPVNRLSRTGLSIAFAVMVAVGLGVYAFFPESIGGPPLPVTVKLDRAAIETTSGIATLTDVVTIANLLDQPIKHLTIILNDQYLIMQDSPLGVGETLVLPQEVFTDKRSSQRFDPSQQNVTEVVVRGQLPNKSRGISLFEFDEQGRLIKVESAAD